jgi:hypothetical protein
MVLALPAKRFTVELERVQRMAGALERVRQGTAPR